jgi:hypothetical protein
VGAESTEHFGAGVLDPREVERLMPEVEVEPLPAVGCASSARELHSDRSPLIVRNPDRWFATARSPPRLQAA